MSDLIAWNTINWALVQKRVSKYQQRIYKASKESNLDKVHGLQLRLVHSLDAKLLAVRRVTTENKGKRTAGVDSQRFLLPESKSQLVKSLCLDGKASPIRRVFIPKPGKPIKRPLGTPIQRDRAKQVLLLLALEPEWEARFEPNSYGFRPGRRCHDAVEAIFLSTRNNRGNPKFNKFVLDADLKGCFDNISHNYLLSKLNTLPAFRKQVLSWLEAGIFEGYLTPDEYGLVQTNSIGTPQGGAISPFLANVALHGMEYHLKKWVCSQPSPSTSRGNAAKQNALAVIRYADDFVLIHPNKEVLFAAKVELSKWLSGTSGLIFNEEKTKLTSLNQGFQFLGFHFISITRNGTPRIKIYPAPKSLKNLLSKVKDIIQNNRNVSSYILISKLRPVIIGWANYYKYCECANTFGKGTHLIFQKLRAWVFRRDTRSSRKKIKDTYFPPGKVYSYDGTKHADNWILFGKTLDKKRSTNAKSVLMENYLPHLSWVKSRKFVKVKGEASIYDGNHTYWIKRSTRYGNLSLSKRKLYLRQQGFCNWCKTEMFYFDPLEIDHIIPVSIGGLRVFQNEQLLHKHCHVEKTRGDGSPL